MTSQDTLGDRMKSYELAFRVVLPRRLPVVIRIDGKAFHTYTAKCQRPFDPRLGDAMVGVAKKLCEEVQGVQLAYTQSDEISLLVHSYKKLNTSAWFDNQVQKMASVAASIASAHFTAESWKIWATQGQEGPTLGTLKPAVFDARCFVLPEADVCNYFLWRQQDASRNSIQMLARSLYSHKECTDKNASELQEMCFKEGKNWNDLATRWKRGVCVINERGNKPLNPKQDGSDGLPCYTKVGWWPDYEIPVFSQDRTYIERHLVLEEE